jgi:hypothetical protein
MRMTRITETALVAGQMQNKATELWNRSQPPECSNPGRCASDAHGKRDSGSLRRVGSIHDSWCRSFKGVNQLLNYGLSK